MSQPNIIGAKRIRNGEQHLFGDNEDKSSFESYLLEFEVNRFQKFRARLGQDVFLGDFKPEKPGCDFEHYFLFWCRVHRKLVVSYLKGEGRRLDCPVLL